MSRKYISQVNNDNFVFPNNRVAEYDVEIIHDINDNCVSGSVINFSATTVTSTGMTISFDYIWDLNGGVPFVRNSGAVSVLSLHMMGPTQNYYKPSTTVGRFVFNDIPITRIESGVTPGFSRLGFTVTPAMIGVPSFTDGVYYFEVKFIGERCVFPVCFSRAISTVTPTPTPTNTPTPTPTPTNTPTPTPTPTVTGCTQSNVCMEFTVTGATGPEQYAGSISYNNCNGVLVNEQFTTQGTRYRCVQFTSGLPQIFSYTGMGAPGIAGGNCNTFECPTGTTTTTSTWTIRNADCGFGTINDIGINGSFMGTLSGPSTFPLTSTLYGTKSNPSGINYGAANTIQANVTTNLPGTGNCAALRVYINGTLVGTTYFTTNPFPQVTGIVINTGDNIEVRTDCTVGPCPDVPTPTPTSTPTATPTSTPTPTPTSTPTPTPTSTPSFVSLSVYTGTSLNSACNSETLTTVYYTGTLGVGTVLYAGPGLTNPIPPIVYLQYAFDDTVYVIGTPSPEDGYITSITNCPTPTPTPTPSPTPPPTVYEFTGCGRGNSISDACNDAGINSRTFYSDCTSGTFGVGCFVYIDTFPNPLTGYSYIFMNGANWDINSSTGQVTALSSEQC